MIAIDSNVLIRYFTEDDQEQLAKAHQVLGGLTERKPGLLTLVGLAEIYWVLRRGYKFDKGTVLEQLQRLIGAREFVVEKPDVARRALQMAAAGADLGDALIHLVGADLGCTETVTFDRGAAKALGMRLLL